MASGQEAPAGPDLRAGIKAGDLPDGGMLAGQVDGEAVLLAHVGNEWFAIGATCSHYSGPLAEGLLVGHTVRCPWHHACFDLRSGEPLRPPALNDVSRWEVEVRDGTVRVGDKRKPAAPRRSASNGPESVLIVGAGAAGNCAAETLRRDGYQGPITILDSDPDAPYDRPNLSKDYLAGNAPEEWIPLHPPEFYQEKGIELRRGPRVVSLDAKSRRVRLENGADVSYGALLLATGASPVRLAELEGGEPRVHYLRTLADSRRIAGAAREGGRAVVIGASFIGLEVAASLRARKMDVHVVAPEARPLERVLGPELGDMVRAIPEEQGVVFHLGRQPKGVSGGRVLLDDGQALPADLLVAGVGVRPNLELAEAAGLAIDRGLQVNEWLETSASGIFAAGDIARWPDPHTGERIRVEHWVVAERQGQSAARAIMGQRDRFDAVPFFWSQHYSVAINYDGHAERWDRIEIDGDVGAHDCTVRYRRGDQVLAVVTVGRDRESLLAEHHFERAVAP
jgi:3-phenylpropionate/trans-cinnamate dioxygenase ferredoxin reductase subunit